MHRQLREISFFTLESISSGIIADFNLSGCRVKSDMHGIFPGIISPSQPEQSSAATKIFGLGRKMALESLATVRSCEGLLILPMRASSESFRPLIFRLGLVPWSGTIEIRVFLRETIASAILCHSGAETFSLRRTEETSSLYIRFKRNVPAFVGRGWGRRDN